MKETLQTIYARNTMPDCGGDKGTAHTYIELYDMYMNNNRHNINLLEIGIYQGHSMIMWSEYFSESQIIGIDLDINQLIFNPQQYQFTAMQLDACSDGISEIFHQKNIMFDYIIDDGSHDVYQQIKAFKNLQQLLKPDGIYFIEDISDIDRSREYFANLTNRVTIHDNRHIKNRSDDVLVVIKN